MKTTINYRVSVNQGLELYAHIEPCGEDLQFANNEFEKISKELSETDTIELQEEVNYSGIWEKVK